MSDKGHSCLITNFGWAVKSRMAAGGSLRHMRIIDGAVVLATLTAAEISQSCVIIFIAWFVLFMSSLITE